MNLVELLFGFGIGGAVGAALAVLTAGNKLTASWNAFAVSFREYTLGRIDPPTQALIVSYEGVDASLGALAAAVQKLKRALRIK